jgi:hypothetical protein
VYFSGVIRPPANLTLRERAEYLQRFRAEHPSLRNKAAQVKVARKLKTNALELQHLSSVFQADVPPVFQDAVDIGLLYWRWAGKIVAKARREKKLHDVDALFWAYDHWHKRTRHVSEGWKAYLTALWQQGLPIYWLWVLGEINLLAKGEQRDAISRVLTKLRDKLREKSVPPGEEPLV